MEKRTMIGLAAAVLIVGGIGLYAALRPVPAKAPGTGATGLLPDPYVEHAAYYDIAANYPTTTPLSAGANVAAVTAMQGFIIDTVSRFKSDGRFDNLTPQDIASMGFDKGRKESLQIVYLISSSAHTVSYIFTVYLDTLGAHPNDYFKTFTFDTTTGKELALGDLFAPGSDYLGTLSAAARARLPGSIAADHADAGYIKSGTEPKEENFQNFFIDNATLDILFPAAQVAPYALGPQTLQIPLADLASILAGGYKP